MSGNTKAGITLSSRVGIETFYDHQKDIPLVNDYTKGKMTNNKSMFIAYAWPGYNAWDYGLSPGVIVEETSTQDLGMIVRSVQGFDREGIILFEYRNYTGNALLLRESKASVKQEFPDGWGGITSFVVYRGVWALYTGENYTHTQVVIDGKSEFGPGSKIPFVGAANNIISSIYQLRDS